MIIIGIWVLNGLQMIMHLYKFPIPEWLLNHLIIVYAMMMRIAIMILIIIMANYYEIVKMMMMNILWNHTDYYHYHHSHEKKKHNSCDILLIKTLNLIRDLRWWNSKDYLSPIYQWCYIFYFFFCFVLRLKVRIIPCWYADTYLREELIFKITWNSKFSDEVTYHLYASISNGNINF